MSDSQTQPIIINNTMHPIVIVARRPADGAGPDGAPAFVIDQLSLKPGANALTPEHHKFVLEQRAKNPLVKARFERYVKRVGAVSNGNAGRPELEDATKMDRHVLEQAIRQCCDADSLRRFRSAFGTDKGLASLIETQLAATTVTTEGEPIAHDVRRDPRDSRKSAA